MRLKDLPKTALFDEPGGCTVFEEYSALRCNIRTRFYMAGK